MLWVIEHADALLTIGMAFALLVIWIMNKAGWVNKEAAREMALGVEASVDSIRAGLKGLDPKKILDKDGHLNIDTIADVAQRAVKGTIKHRMLTGLRSVGEIIKDTAAEADPDPKKQPRPVLRRLRGLLRARFFGG
jgi:hypothetical protein